MTPIVLFRKSLAEEGEIEVCRKYFYTVEYRSDIPRNSFVIPRYSYLPYPLEFEHDIKNIGGALINSYDQHRWIADFEWYDVLKDYTPESWTYDNFFLCQYEGPFIAKGATNSRKNQWNSMMFAQTKRRASEIACELKNDGLICNQKIIYRKYIPLENLEIGINGLPFSNEWRFFFYKDKRLSHGFYWSISEHIPKECNTQLEDFAEMLAGIVKDYANFYVLDVAMTEKQEPILVEINDGCCSGLSECCAEELYFNLKKVLT